MTTASKEQPKNMLLSCELVKFMIHSVGEINAELSDIFSLGMSFLRLAL